MIHLNLVVIKTNRQEELIPFYNALGIEFEHHKHGSGPYHYVADLGAVTFEIYALPKGVETADDTTRLGFTIVGLNDTILKLAALGVEIIQAPASTEWGYAAVVKDVDGRKIELVEKIKE